MKRLASLAVYLMSTVCALANGEAHYEAAAKAAAAKDFSTALTEFEGALTENPDSIKYASEYRMAVIRAKDHDRCIKFFETLVANNPKSASAYLNYGFAYVDKIPVAGTITQVILANTALANFSKSIELAPTWIAYYTRGNSYLFWPKIFGRTPLGVADLEQAMKIQKADQQRPYHVRVYISLGDAYWKMDDMPKAKSMWQEGLSLFPENSQLKARLSREGDELKNYIEDTLDPGKRVDTNLVEFWADK